MNVKGLHSQSLNATINKITSLFQAAIFSVHILTFAIYICWILEKRIKFLSPKLQKS